MKMSGNSNRFLDEPVETARQGVGYDPRATKNTNPKDAIGDKKVPLWLCSAIAKAHWALAQFAGLLKYGAWNWREAGVRSSVYLSAMQRHLDRYENGEEYDPVDGTHHLGNIMACAAILLEARAIGKLTDDRPPRASVDETYKYVEERMQCLREKYAEMRPRHYTIDDARDPACWLGRPGQAIPVDADHDFRKTAR
jgi:hypothetical protein